MTVVTVVIVVTVVTVVIEVTVVTVVTVITVVTLVGKKLCLSLLFLALKLWQNSKTLIITKLKNSNFEEKKTKIQTVTKLKTTILSKKYKKKSNCDKTHKLKLWQNSKTPIVTNSKTLKGDKTKQQKK